MTDTERRAQALRLAELGDTVAALNKQLKRAHAEGWETVFQIDKGSAHIAPEIGVTLRGRPAMNKAA